eukprot:UN05887
MFSRVNKLHHLKNRHKINRMDVNQLKKFESRANETEERLTKLESHVQSLSGGDYKGKKVILQTPNFPKWTQPSGKRGQLNVLNSLVPDRKVPFIPENGNTVNWYQCGPTTYAPSHLGHARAYITFDIMRRLLQDYFWLP